MLIKLPFSPNWKGFGLFVEAHIDMDVLFVRRSLRLSCVVAVNRRELLARRRPPRPRLSAPRSHARRPPRIARTTTFPAEHARRPPRTARTTTFSAEERTAACRAARAGGSLRDLFARIATWSNVACACLHRLPAVGRRASYSKLAVWYLRRFVESKRCPTNVCGHQQSAAISAITAVGNWMRE